MMYELFDNWYMVGWLLGAGFLLRCGASIYDGLISALRELRRCKKKP